MQYFFLQPLILKSEDEYRFFSCILACQRVPQIVPGMENDKADVRGRSWAVWKSSRPEDQDHMQGDERIRNLQGFPHPVSPAKVRRDFTIWSLDLCIW